MMNDDEIFYIVIPVRGEARAHQVRNHLNWLLRKTQFWPWIERSSRKAEPIEVQQKGL